MSVRGKYLDGLRQAYFENDGRRDWEHFEKTVHGASQEHLSNLRELYPDLPDALRTLLEFVDGSYWRKYGDEEITFFMLGSDLFEYPYYLLSAEQMIESRNLAQEYYSEHMERKYDGVKIDDKITNQASKLRWLHFSNCLNNGGSSQLFIDFNPSEKGKIGQVIRFVHDPDEFKVIADSFDDYLVELATKGFDFITPDIMEHTDQ